jgi:hypothetical protein
VIVFGGFCVDLVKNWLVYFLKEFYKVQASRCFISEFLRGVLIKYLNSQICLASIESEFMYLRYRTFVMIPSSNAKEKITPIAKSLHFIHLFIYLFIHLFTHSLIYLAMLRIDPKASHMLSNYSTTELYPYPSLFYNLKCLWDIYQM